MYDIKDENYSGYLEGLLLANLPIDFYGLKIKQLTVKEVLLMGEDKFSKLIKPFTINTKLIEQIKDTDLQTLDIIYGLEGEFLDNTKECLCLLFGVTTDEISILNNPRPELVIKNDKNFVFIDCNKFEELKDIILKMFNTRELNEDDIKRNEEMRFKDSQYDNRFAKLFKGRERKKKKNNADFRVSHIYNLVIHSQSNVDYNIPLLWGIYQLYNTYKNLSIKESHNFTNRIYSSGMVDIRKEDIKTLYQRLSNK